ncbi:hypothetical protein DICVIV_03317 [Dictyocaulus viviparus]|uniref:Uncharacterized protein n=1 Tax=Dictyocaulus viviparus TaxID=29172 RepID=A0A0D8Y7H6_DICVI|nr:hypothetical protein DICVIV_03317 [Dictyocaulus viviparus]
MQSPLVRVCLQLLNIILFAEEAPEWVLQITNSFGVISTIIAIYVCHVIVTATKEVLTPFNMYVIFRCVDVTQMLYTFQEFILDLIIKHGGVNGLPIATPTMIVRFWHNVAMIIEVTLICMVMFKNIQPGKSAFFTNKEQSFEDNRPIPILTL